MDSQSEQRSSESGVWRVKRLEPALVIAVLACSMVIGLIGLALSGPDLLVPLAVLLVSVFLFNFLLLWLDRRGGAQRATAWGALLGNQVFLTLGVYLTGGFHSPFFSLYAAYIVVASLQRGWRGAVRSFALCFLGWMMLGILAPPVDVQDWAWVTILVGSHFLVALIVGDLAHQHAVFTRRSQQRSRELAFLREAGRSLGASLEPQAVLAETLAKVNELLEVEAASLALVEPSTGRISFELAIGGGNESVRGLRLEPGEGIVGQVIQEGRPVLVPDVSAEPKWYEGVDEISGYRTRSLLCVPLRVKGQAIGALEVLNKRDGPFSEHDQQLLSSLADVAAQGIENARLHDEIRQNAERLQEAYEELQKLDELKSNFIRNVSHELRTPLALMRGYLELVLDGQLGSLTSEQEQSLAVVAERSAHLTHIVNDIITLQTIGAMGYDLEVLCLKSLAEEALERARTWAEKGGVELELEPPVEDLPRIRGDARRLGRVFDHLLDNAIKFSPDGGTVHLSLQREGAMVRTQIRDEGIGLSTDQFERVFDRFYQVDGAYTRRFGGSGLGLALVKEVIEAHGGAVWVESEGVPGKGSTFSFFLPALKEDAAA
jgi:signal transduction histidine kinase